MLFSQDIGIDLGTANTLVFVKGKGIVIREPSVVAINVSARPAKVVAVGKEAKEMIGRTPGSIAAMRPITDGVIADFDITCEMLKKFIQKALGGSYFAKARVVICIPTGVTEVERRNVHDVAIEAGAKYVSLIEETMAAAIGAGLPVSDAVGSMIVAIGGGTALTVLSASTSKRSITFSLVKELPKTLKSKSAQLWLMRAKAKWRSRAETLLTVFPRMLQLQVRKSERLSLTV